ncbi:MAG: hypothetical protein WA673_22820, partial [Candidatus Acidiferrales bacterium]
HSAKSHAVTALTAPIKMNWCQMVPSCYHVQENASSPAPEKTRFELSGNTTDQELGRQSVQLFTIKDLFSVIEWSATEL